jgi:hypothetical protein
MFFHVRSAITIGAGCIGAPLVLADYMCAYFHGLYKQEMEILRRKDDGKAATLKIKLTSIATVRNHILTVACFPTPVIFHYPLPLKGLK